MNELNVFRRGRLRKYRNYTFTNEQKHELELDLAVMCCELSSVVREKHTMRKNGCSAPSLLKAVYEPWAHTLSSRDL